MAKMQKKNLNTSPDETNTFENGKIEWQILVTLQLVELYFNQAGVGKKCQSHCEKQIARQVPHTQVHCFW